MSDSILNSTKKSLGLAEDYSAFDSDVLMHINSALSVLAQLGVGPAAGFMVLDETATWEDLLGQDDVLNMAKTYVFLRVKMVFDAPSTAHHLNAMETQINELGWRINAHREATQWVDPDPRHPSEDVFGDPVVIDGGVG